MSNSSSSSSSNDNNKSEVSTTGETKETININSESIPEIQNAVDNDLLFYNKNIKLIENYDQLKNILIKYDNTLSVLNDTIMTITRSNLYDINNESLINYSNVIITYANKLFNYNKFVISNTNINCAFDCKLDDSLYTNVYKDVYFIDPLKTSKYITSNACVNFKEFIENILVRYFKILNELIVYLYVIEYNKNNNNLSSLIKYKFKCKRNFNKPNIIYNVVEKDSSGNHVSNFGERKDRVLKKKKSQNIQKIKNKPIEKASTFSNTNWPEVDKEVKNDKQSKILKGEDSSEPEDKPSETASKKNKETKKTE